MNHPYIRVKFQNGSRKWPGNGNRIVQMLIWFSHEIQVEIKKIPIIQVCKDTIYKDMFSFEYFNNFIH